MTSAERKGPRAHGDGTAHNAARTRLARSASCSTVPHVVQGALCLSERVLHAWLGHGPSVQAAPCGAARPRRRTSRTAHAQSAAAVHGQTERRPMRRQTCAAAPVEASSAVPRPSWRLPCRIACREAGPC